MKKQRKVIVLKGGERPIEVDAMEAREALVAVQAVSSHVRREIIGQLENVPTMTLDQLSETLRIPKGFLPQQMRPLERTGIVISLPREEYCLNQVKLNQVTSLINDVAKA